MANPVSELVKTSLLPFLFAPQQSLLHFKWMTHPTHSCFLLIFPRHSLELIVCKANLIAFYQDNEIDTFHRSLSLTIGESHF